MCIIWHLANPITISVPGGKGRAFFTCHIKGLSTNYLLVSSSGQDVLAMTDWQSLLKLILLDLLSVNKVLFHPVSVWVMFFLAMPTPANSAVGRHLAIAFPGGWQQVLVAQQFRAVSKVTSNVSTWCRRTVFTSPAMLGWCHLPRGADGLTEYWALSGRMGINEM